MARRSTPIFSCSVSVYARLSIWRNRPGYRERFDAVPFFWSQHYDVTINYVGHAEQWDRIEIEGSLDARDCAVTYMRGERKLAAATMSRDLSSLRAEALMEGQINTAGR